jgi:hypothetical protein
MSSSKKMTPIRKAALNRISFDVHFAGKRRKKNEARRDDGVKNKL